MTEDEYILMQVLTTVRVALVVITQPAIPLAYTKEHLDVVHRLSRLRDELAREVGELEES